MSEEIVKEIHFFCVKCNQWYPKSQFNIHKVNHRGELYDYPDTYEGFKKRFSAIGTFEEHEGMPDLPPEEGQFRLK